MEFVEKNLELIAINPQPERRLMACQDDQVSQDFTNGLNKNYSRGKKCLYSIANSPTCGR